MKLCSKCKVEKSESEFYSKGLNRLQSYCKTCSKSYRAAHYKKNSKKYIKKMKDRRKSIRSHFKEVKSNTPCVDCDVIYPSYVMQYDHLSNKEGVVSQMVGHGYGKETIQKEIDKCELVCANCHAIRTHARINAGVAQR